MRTEEISKVYFIGIGGIGMSALARYFKKLGKEVSGYDKTQTQLTDQLINEGINLHFEDDTNLADTDADLVVYTPAIPKNHLELNYFLDGGFVVKKRAEVLGDLSKQYNTIAVAGTHGKTTTSSIIAHILNQTSDGCTAFIGGIMSNYNTNFLNSPPPRGEVRGGALVVEADEYDRSFLTLQPNTAIITSIDADHLDVYGKEEELKSSFQGFLALVQDKLIAKHGIDVKHTNLITYSREEPADYYAKNITIVNATYCFDLATPSSDIKGLEFKLPGNHNLENAIAACAAAIENGCAEVDLRNGLSSYQGVKRRFETLMQNDDLVLIDDYAHHPKELDAAIQAAKMFYPDKRITGVFQPHLYSRTRDFADEFAQSLSQLNEVVLLPIYPAREESIEGVNSGMLLKKIKAINKHLFTKDEAVQKIVQLKPEVLLVLGAGDIDQLVEPLKKAFSEGK